MISTNIAQQRNQLLVMLGALTDGTPQSEAQLIRLEYLSNQQPAIDSNASSATLPAILQENIVPACTAAIETAMIKHLGEKLERWRVAGTGPTQMDKVSTPVIFDEKCTLTRPKNAKLVDLSLTKNGIEGIKDSIEIISKVAADLIGKKQSGSREVSAVDILLITQRYEMDLAQRHFNIFSPKTQALEGLWLSPFNILQIAGIIGIRSGNANQTKYPIIWEK